MLDLIIVGSGPGGVWAARQAAKRGLKPLILDVGIQPGPEAPLSRDLFALRREDAAQADYLLGKDFESLNNLHQPFLSPKLKSPRFRFVTARSAELAPTQDLGFHATQSLAQGGLANAWGAALHRYDDGDLRAFPLKRGDLDPYYDALGAEIGISGGQDDLSEPGDAAGSLQPPCRPDRLAERLLSHYESRRQVFWRRGIRLGRPRLALLSRRQGGREACAYDNLSFWQPGLSYIYTPTMTLLALRGAGQVDYQAGWLAESFKEDAGGVRVRARRVDGGGSGEFSARKLILAAGALGSARIVLRSFNDTRTRLPLLENPTTLTPFFHPAFIGAPVQEMSHGLAQLGALYEGPAWEGRVKGGFYGYSSPLASDVFGDLPLSARGVLKAFKYLLPAVGVLQLFYADKGDEANCVWLDEDGRLATQRGSLPRLGAVERVFIHALRRGGFLSLPRLSRALPPGNGIHYAGTLPMAEAPGLPYRTDSAGRLQQARRVHVADAAVFPALPAKNHSFTLMALAMRTADAAADELGAGA